MYPVGKLNKNTEVIALVLLTNGEQSINEKDEEKKMSKIKIVNNCQFFLVFFSFLNIIF